MEAQLTFDAADRLVDLVEERRAPVAAEEAARALFALAFAPGGLAQSLLDDVVSGDSRREGRPSRSRTTRRSDCRSRGLGTSSSTWRRPASGPAAPRSARSERS